VFASFFKKKRLLAFLTMTTSGRFITIEGGEGAGKSTQAAHLAQALAEAGIPVLRTREPGGAPGAEKLRSLLLDTDITWSPQAEALLHFAARAEHVQASIRPALEAGLWVICDRFFDSTMAYQGHAQGAGVEAVRTLRHLLALEPDLTIMLDLALPAALTRMASRGRAADRYERLGDAFLARVNQAFLDIAAAEPDRCLVIAADGGEHTVAARVREAVWQRLPPT
jgi:dTMP kinase